MISVTMQKTPSFRHRLVARRPPGLRDDLGHLVHLSLRAAEGAELRALVIAERKPSLGIPSSWPAGTKVSTVPQIREKPYLSGALVLAVAQQFNDTPLCTSSGQVDMLGQLLTIRRHAYNRTVISPPPYQQQTCQDIPQTSRTISKPC